MTHDGRMHSEWSATQPVVVLQTIGNGATADGSTDGLQLWMLTSVKSLAALLVPLYTAASLHVHLFLLHGPVATGPRGRYSSGVKERQVTVLQDLVR